MKPHLIVAALVTVVVLGYGVRAISVDMHEIFNRQRIEQEHRLYAFSVVPGGVYSKAELIRSYLDPVVDRHYANLGPMVRMERLGGNYFDSYRMADRVYWTSYRVHVESSELVWHEKHGLGMIRPRCGNRLSLTPMQPTLSATLEPTPEQLNDIPPTSVPVDYGIIPYTPGVLNLLSPPGVDRMAFSAPLAPMPGYIFGGPIAERADDVAAVIPAAVPEPNSIWLFATGVLFLISLALLVVTGRKR